MFCRGKKNLRPIIFSPARDRMMFPFNKITQTFPLIYENNLAFKAGRGFPYYTGVKPVNPERHPHPNLPKVLTNSKIPDYTPWDMRLCPTLITGRTLQPTEEFVGRRTGMLLPMVGWVRPGFRRRHAMGYDAKWKYSKYKYLGRWVEYRMTPRWKRSPRVGPSGPGARWQGRLLYSNLPLKKLMWAIETGRLNSNERITLYHLVESKVLAEWEIVWPGIKLVAGELDTLSRPIHIELQQATAKAIELIEKAGGSFTCTYMSPHGMYEEIFPEEFPIFTEQHMPDRRAFETASTNPEVRGYLTKWYESTSKYADPTAGRRLSHYVSPPLRSDFPATLQEYERVKHHQKWHLGQPGTGSILPWLSERSNLRQQEDDFDLPK